MRVIISRVLFSSTSAWSAATREDVQRRGAVAAMRSRTREAQLHPVCCCCDGGLQRESEFLTAYGDEARPCAVVAETVGERGGDWGWLAGRRSNCCSLDLLS